MIHVRVTLGIAIVAFALAACQAGGLGTAPNEVLADSPNEHITAGEAPTSPVPPGSSPWVERPPDPGATPLISLLQNGARSTNSAGGADEEPTTLTVDWGPGDLQEALIDSGGTMYYEREIALEGGAYRFYVWSEGGYRLWVNGRPVVDRWPGGDPAVAIGHLWLDRSGPAAVRFAYHATDGPNQIKLRWERITWFSGWRAEYYPNRYLTGQPLLVRDDAAPLFDWGHDAPALGVPADDFSVRWTRTMQLVPGCYRFTARADAGVRVYVDDALLINGWNAPAGMEHARDVVLDGGEHTVVVEYFEDVGKAYIAVEWERLGGVESLEGANDLTRCVIGQGPALEPESSARTDRFATARVREAFHGLVRWVTGETARR